MDAVAGTSSTTVTNSDGSTTTTTTYADGSTATLSTPAAAPSSSSTGSGGTNSNGAAANNASSKYNFVDQMIQKQAQALSASASHRSLFTPESNRPHTHAVTWRPVHA